MARISDNRIPLLRPEFGDANALLTAGLKSYKDSVTPIKEAMAANFVTRKDQAQGQLNNFIQQNMPTDYSNNPESALAFQKMLNQVYDSSGLYNEGISANDLNASISGREKLNQSSLKEQLTNNKLQLVNVKDADEMAYNQLTTQAVAEKWSLQRRAEEAAKMGLTTDVYGNFLKEDQQKLTNDALANAPVFAAADALQQAKIAQQTGVIANNASSSAANFVAESANRNLQNAFRGGSVKMQAPVGNTSSTTTNRTTGAVSKYQPLAQKAAQVHGIPEDIIMAVMGIESSGDPNARSPVGAHGLMQLKPDTAKEMGVINSADPEQNIMGGAKYLAKMQKKYNGNMNMALVAYNYGPGNTDEWIKKGAKYSQLPKETQNYLNKMAGTLKNSTPNSKKNTESNIIYTNSNAKRNEPLSKELTNVIGSVAADLGVTVKVHSGGQSNTSKGREGGPRHDHGNAADARFYIGNRQLKHSNPEDRAILSRIIEESAARGATGIGGGDGYMGDGILHVGFGGSATWGGKDGAGAAPAWISQAHAKGVARQSGQGQVQGQGQQYSSGSSGGFDGSELLQGLTSTISREPFDNTLQVSNDAYKNNVDNQTELMGLLTLSDRENSSLDSMERRAGLPTNANNETIQKANAIRDRDYVQSMGALQIAGINQELMSNDALTAATRNNEATDLFQQRYAEAAANAQANSAIPISQLFTPEDMEGAKALLAKYDMTFEDLKNLDGNTQKTFLNEVMKYQQAVKTNQGKAVKNREAYDKTLLKLPKSIDTVLKQDGVKALTEAQYKGNVDAADKNKSWYKPTAYEASQNTKRATNLNGVNTQIANMVSTEISANGKKHLNMYTTKDLTSIMPLIFNRYKSEQALAGYPDSPDIIGSANKIQNPGLMEKVIKYYLDGLYSGADKKKTKATQVAQVAEPKFENQIQSNLLNMIGTSLDK